MQAGGSGKKEGAGQGGNKSGQKGGQQDGEEGKGGGTGGKGTGDGGGAAPEKDSEYTEQDSKLRSKMQEGEIIGQYFKRGTPPTGEAKKKLGEVIDRSRQEAQDAMNDQGYSPAEHKLIKGYSDYLRNMFDDKDSGAENK